MAARPWWQFWKQRPVCWKCGRATIRDGFLCTACIESAGVPSLQYHLERAVDAGLRDQLQELIKICPRYDDGLSLLEQARRLCPERWHALRKDLDKAIRNWRPPPAAAAAPPPGPGNDSPQLIRYRGLTFKADGEYSGVWDDGRVVRGIWYRQSDDINNSSRNRMVAARLRNSGFTILESDYAMTLVSGIGGVEPLKNPGGAILWFASAQALFAASGQPPAAKTPRAPASEAGPSAPSRPSDAIEKLIAGKKGIDLTILARSTAKRSTVLISSDAKWHKVSIDGWRYVVNQEIPGIMLLKPSTGPFSTPGFELPDGLAGGLDLQIQFDEPVWICGNEDRFLINRPEQGPIHAITVYCIPSSEARLAKCFKVLSR